MLTAAEGETVPGARLSGLPGAVPLPLGSAFHHLPVTAKGSPAPGTQECRAAPSAALTRWEGGAGRDCKSPDLGLASPPAPPSPPHPPVVPQALARPTCSAPCFGPEVHGLPPAARDWTPVSRAWACWGSLGFLNLMTRGLHQFCKLLSACPLTSHLFPKAVQPPPACAGMSTFCSARPRGHGPPRGHIPATLGGGTAQPLGPSAAAMGVRLLYFPVTQAKRGLRR